MYSLHHAVEVAAERAAAVLSFIGSADPAWEKDRADEVAGLDAGDAGADLDHVPAPSESGMSGRLPLWLP